MKSQVAMKIVPAVKTARSTRPKPISLAKTKAPTTGHRRRDAFAALRVISEMLPRSADIDGHAQGNLSVKQVAAAAGVSNKASARAFRFWRAFRVLWLAWRGKGVWEVRFDRQVVDHFIEMPAVTSGEVHKALMAHRQQRQAVAPWKRIGQRMAGLH